MNKTLKEIMTSFLLSNIALINFKITAYRNRDVKVLQMRTVSYADQHKAQYMLWVAKNLKSNYAKFVPHIMS